MRSPLEYAKQKISDKYWNANVVFLLEDVMDVNKSFC